MWLGLGASGELVAGFAFTSYDDRGIAHMNEFEGNESERMRETVNTNKHML